MSPFQALNHLDDYQDRSPGSPFSTSIRAAGHELDLYKYMPCYAGYMTLHSFCRSGHMLSITGLS